MALSHLLAAADGSEAGRHAFRVATRLAGTLGARLSAMTVLGVGAELPAYLESSAPFVASGVAGVEIARRAEIEEVDLIVLGRGREPACLPRLGSTADALVRRSRVACLFVPRGQYEFRHAVVAADGTDRGMTVLRSLPDLSDLGVQDVNVRLVERTDRLPAPVGSPSVRGERVSRALSAVGQRGPQARLTVLHGDPVRTVLDAVADAGQPVLVVGARRGGPSADRSSGVGRRLLYEAPCAVLTIPI